MSEVRAIERSADWSWPWWPLVPLYPYGQRRTLRREVISDQVWTFDQIQGIFYVVVPIRMTVIRLAAGGLLVYAPVAPTPECLRLVNELVELHGDVKYIILPTVTGLEHKVFVGPFARQFQAAQVYVARHQWSFPLNLPLSWLGFPGGRTHWLPENPAEAPFGDEFDYRVLGPVNLGIGPFSEVALLHRASKTLLVTDAVVSIPADPPAIVQLNSYPLLFHAKDSAADAPADTVENRRKGWQRIALFAFYFRPDALKDPQWGKVLQAIGAASDRSKRAYFGLYPFDWEPNWQQSFERLSDQGRLLVAPVLQSLIFNRGSQAVLTWADQVADLPFEWVIPCHLDAPIKTDGTTFRKAFSFLSQENMSGRGGHLPEADFGLLNRISRQLERLRLTPPPGP
ncbi:hypothetical protein N836_28210 [Leptolyngbya sp. Heron Island J]|uniref:DUF4336 domain-containing protein n=1 Tax=Leptolyngbya sp. Heron Island J TaxID=1385935 RepID=UPI0003B96BA4|nr:DUF4336 domain-containing protein [Leptolyngbya sp. Heron Island J]ESA32041.1 hypothetical protein N836_28210 [Leptolyngbya sp. Heron Island J]